MITDTSWIVPRHPYAFLPKPWQVSLCCRDLTAEVLPNVQERRCRFAIDLHSGYEWSREGTGHYVYWTHLPPLEAWCPYSIQPPLRTLCVFWLKGGHYAGLHVGQVSVDALDNTSWKIQEHYSSKWSQTLSTNIQGWLLLPYQ